jgi:hypothetical protein
MKDEYYNDKDEDYMMDLEEKIGSRSNVLTPVVHKCGEDVQPSQHLIQEQDRVRRRWQAHEVRDDKHVCPLFAM